MRKTFTGARFCMFAAAVLGLATGAKGDYGIGFKPRVELGDTLGGTFSEPVDLSSYAGPEWELGFDASLAGINPDLPMTIELFHQEDYSQKALYSGFTESLLAGDTFLPLARVAAPAAFDYSKVGGMQISWDGSGVIDISLSHLSARTSNGTTRVNLAPLWAGAFLVEPSATTASYTQTPPPPPAPSGGSFSASAPGGVLFLVGGATAELASRATNWTYAQISPGGTSWGVTSDSNAKTDITAIDHREVLRGVASLPVSTWKYRHDTERSHIGPMAQDFRQAFGLGFDDKHISTLDADGVALSALKGLIEELRERQQRSAAQAKRLSELEIQLRDLRGRIGDTLPPRP